jgi:Amt family ammonium transporter
MYLSKLPVHELKIDQSFITDLVANGDNRSIIVSVLFLADRLGLKTVAEGIDTKKQLHFFQDNNCNQYQGCLLSQPLPADELSVMLPIES